MGTEGARKESTRKRDLSVFRIFSPNLNPNSREVSLYASHQSSSMTCGFSESTDFWSSTNTQHKFAKNKLGTHDNHVFSFQGVVRN